MFNGFGGLSAIPLEPVVCIQVLSGLCDPLHLGAVLDPEGHAPRPRRGSFRTGRDLGVLSRCWCLRIARRYLRLRRDARAALGKSYPRAERHALRVCSSGALAPPWAEALGAALVIGWRWPVDPTGCRRRPTTRCLLSKRRAFREVVRG